MKRITIIAITATLLLSMAACADKSVGLQKSAPTATTPSDADFGADTIAENEVAEVRAHIATSVEIRSSAPDMPVNSPMVTGLITYCDGVSLMLVTNDMKSLMFDISDAGIDKTTVQGLAEGSEVDVYYSGIINGSDVSKAEVIRLVQTEEQAVVKSNIRAISGEITESDGAFIALRAPSGEVLIFDVSGDDIDKSEADNLVAGAFVTILYTGDIDMGTGGNIIVTKLSQ